MPVQSKRVKAVNFAIEHEALSILRQLAISERSLGAVISRLVYEDRARREERAAVQQERARKQRDMAAIVRLHHGQKAEQTDDAQQP